MALEQTHSLISPVEISTDASREEDAVIRRATLGDSAAIDSLICKYRVRAVRLASHILLRPSEAEDAAQEAFINAFQNLRTYRFDGRFYTWLYTIVVRVCLNRKRASRWNSEVDLESVADKRCAPDSALVDAELAIVVETLLTRLNPRQRAMLVLRELEGLEYAEIADALSIPVGRVKWQLHQARRQFQELWKAMQQETADV